ncbi:MAG: FAD:protein FMN transferase [Planctomycetota bacterium]|nr:FAD:protein FMN transferase [Planctomycetota bacterium]
MRRFLSHVTLLTVLAVSFPGCKAPAEVLVVVSGRTMGTTYTVKCVGIGSADLGAIVEKELEAVNANFSTYDPQSEISRFNAHQLAEPFVVSKEFAELVARALAVAEATGGAFDPTIMPLVDLYGFGPMKERRLPSDTEIEAAMTSVGWRKLKIGSDGRLHKEAPGVQLDLSAMAKGYGVDRVAAALEEAGTHSYMVEIGGEVRCHGAKPGGAPWVIGIERPPSDGGDDPIIEKVRLGDDALATSGSYRNVVVSSGSKAHHILDPRTGKNAESAIVSVSVRASNCALADALATALMVIAPDQAASVLDAFSGEDLRVFFILRGEEDKWLTHELRWH